MNSAETESLKAKDQADLNLPTTWQKKVNFFT